MSFRIRNSTIRYSHLAIITFVLVLWMPVMQMQLNLFTEGMSNEKRKLAKLPILKGHSLKSIKIYLADYEKYFNDNFGFRNILVDINNRVDVQIFHISPVPKLIIGKKNWIYYRSELEGVDGNTINDYQGQIPFTSSELEQIKIKLELITHQLRNMNMYFLVVIVPNKETIYPEYLPNSIIETAKKTRLDQLSEYLKDNPNIHFINLKEDLLDSKSKTKYPLYYKGGTHWNQYGAFFGYQRIINDLTPLFTEVETLSLDDFTVTVDEKSSNDSWFDFVKDYSFTFTPKRTASIESVRRQSAIVKEIPGSRLPRLLLFRDSFAENLIPILSENFSRSVYLPGETFNYQIIKSIQPDIVIIEHVERYLELLNKPKICSRTAYPLGIEYYKKGEYENAKLSFERAILEDPNNFLLRNYLGVTYDELKEYDKAVTTLTETIDTFPFYVDAYFSLGTTYNHAGNYNQALAIYKVLLNMNVKPEETHSALGETYFYKGDYASAMDEFGKVAAINPKRFDCYYNMAYIYAVKKDFQSAINCLEKAANAGFRDFESVKKDEVFALIIRDERFKRLEKSLSNKTPQVGGKTI